MSNTRYGGRYADNFIDDIQPPEKKRGLIPARDGMDTFRPFEEVADNFVNTTPVKLKARKVEEPSGSYAVPIQDVASQPKQANDYTYVPPLSTLRPDDEVQPLSKDSEVHHKEPKDTKAKIAAFVSGAVAAWVIRPYHALAKLWDEHVMTRKYSIAEGAGYEFDRDAEDSLKAAGLGALLIAGLLVVSYGLLDNQVKKGEHIKQSQQSAAAAQANSGSGGKGGGSNSGSGNNKTTSATNASSATTQPRAGTSGQPGSTTNTLQGGTSTLTGGMGGGSSNGTSTGGTTGGTTVQDPTTLLPNQSVTVPPTSVDLNGKPILSTDGATITTN